MNRVGEFDAEMQRIAEAAAIAHHQEFFAGAKPLGHVFGHRLNLAGVLVEEFLLHLDAFAAFAEDFVAIGFGRTCWTRVCSAHGALPAPWFVIRRGFVSADLQMAAIGIIRGTGALGGYHRRAQRMFAACIACRRRDNHAVS